MSDTPTTIRDMTPQEAFTHWRAINDANPVPPVAWVQPHLWLVAKPGWRVVMRGADGMFVVSADGLKAILSGQVEADGKRWLHLSISREGRIPAYGDLQRVRTVMGWLDDTTYMVWPPRDRYVNLHPFVLHLWRCLDGPVTPEFSQVHGGVRSL